MQLSCKYRILSQENQKFDCFLILNMKSELNVLGNICWKDK